MLTAFRITFGILAAIKAVQLTTLATISTEGGPTAAADVGIALSLGVAMVVAAVFFAVGRGVRPAALVMLAGFLLFIFAFGFYNHHTYLISVICAIFVLGTHVAQLLKIQLTIVYAFAALTKINETYLAGSELYASVVQHSFWQTVIGVDPSPLFLVALAVGSVLAEAFLAVGLWFARTRKVALVVGLCLHVGLVILVTDAFNQFINLSIYGGVTLALYLPFFADELDSRRSREKSTGEREPSPTRSEPSPA